MTTNNNSRKYQFQNIKVQLVGLQYPQLWYLKVIQIANKWIAIVMNRSLYSK